MTQKPTCPAVDDGKKCDRPLYLRGLCETHYRRLLEQHGGDIPDDACSAVVNGKKCTRKAMQTPDGLCFEHWEQRERGEL